jgi:hypothetical protein
MLRGVVCGGFAAADTSYVIVRASFAPIHHSKQPFTLFHSTGDPNRGVSSSRPNHVFGYSYEVIMAVNGGEVAVKLGKSRVQNLIILATCRVL